MNVLFALSESNEHILIAAIVGLLTAVTTLVGVYTTILVVTRRQTRQLVGEPRSGPTGQPVAAPTLTDLAATAAGTKKTVTSVEVALNGDGVGGRLGALETRMGGLETLVKEAIAAMKAQRTGG